MTIQPIKKNQKINTPFLKNLPKKYQTLLLKKAGISKLEKGAYIFRDGEKAIRFYLILKGKVDLLSKEQDVRFDVESNTGILQTLVKGDVIGWSWVIPPYQWRFDAKAGEACELLVIDGLEVRKQMAKDHAFGFEVYKRLVPVMNQRLIAARLKFQLFGGNVFAAAEGG